VADKVCVVGAGASGLVVTKYLHQAGVQVACFDKRDRIGGIWAYSDDTAETTAWQGLHINTPRGYYEYSDFPMPADYPDFPSHTLVWTYLNDYVNHFGFKENIHLGAEVCRIEPDSGGWRVALKDGTAERYGSVVIANGHHNTPRYPTLKGTFGGGQIHSQAYRRRDAYANKRVLVVGYGNSGAQIAVDVSYAAEQVFLSARDGFYVWPHYLRGKRITWWMHPSTWWWLYHVPWSVRGRLFSLAYRLLVCHPEAFGLPTPKHFASAKHPTISENFFNRLGDGKIKLKPDVAELAGSRVLFKDGSSEAMDEIIYCTGYDTTFPFLDQRVFSVKDNDVRLFKRTFLPSAPGLLFVGAYQAIHFGFPELFEMQAKLIAAYLTGNYALPSSREMEDDIERDRRRTAEQFGLSPRGNYQMNGPLFLHECERELKRGLKRAKRPTLRRINHHALRQ